MSQKTGDQTITGHQGRRVGTQIITDSRETIVIVAFSFRPVPSVAASPYIVYFMLPTLICVQSEVLQFQQPGSLLPQHAFSQQMTLQMSADCYLGQVIDSNNYTGNSQKTTNGQASVERSLLVHDNVFGSSLTLLGCTLAASASCIVCRPRSCWITWRGCSPTSQ